ncbi:MAG: NAD(+) diphosphatase [Rhodobacteraceae bacterium]|nr:NAD(+) diphosphatase [Paracoccaceae bacterium]
MKNAEAVTFGGSGLDRAAELRGLAELAEGQCIVLWRGKPAVTEDGTLTRIPRDHPIAALCPAPVLMGREDDGTILEAFDLSAWEPDGLDASALTGFLDPTLQVHPDLPGSAFAELRGMMTQLSPRDAELAATARAIFEWHRTHGFCSTCGAKSEVAMRGWQTNCPSCGRHHFPRTDPVVIMLILRGNSVLVGRSPGWPEGMYSLLAGFVEPGETLEAAVRREVFEETHVKVGEVGYLSSQPWPFPASLMFGCIGDALSEDIIVDPEELEDARWVTREEMLEAMAGRHPEIAAARKGAIAHFLLSRWVADQLD